MDASCKLQDNIHKFKLNIYVSRLLGTHHITCYSYIIELIFTKMYRNKRLLVTLNKASYNKFKTSIRNKKSINNVTITIGNATTAELSNIIFLPLLFELVLFVSFSDCISLELLFFSMQLISPYNYSILKI